MENKEGVIYILINEAMEGYIKVGKTTDLEARIRSLDTTSVPLPFECFFAARVADMDFVEKQLHDAFADSRVRSNREFFEVAPERVVAALKLAMVEDVTPHRDYVETQEDEKALEKARKKRARFNFKFVDIAPGSILTFTRDELITVKVINETKIEYNGEVTSLSDAAQKVLDVPYKVAGTLYWEYEGETLDERRRRYEVGDVNDE